MIILINPMDKSIYSSEYEKLAVDCELENIYSINYNEIIYNLTNSNEINYNFTKIKSIININYDNTNYIENLNYFENSIKYFNNKNILLNIYKNNLSDDKLKKYIITDNKISISIIIHHINKPDLLFVSLYSLNKSKFNNFEVIVVDNSSENLKPKFINNLFFNFPIKLISINNIESISRSSLYNLGFNHSIGDQIIIQNSEYVHIEDNLKYIENNLNYDDCIFFEYYLSENIETNNNILENLYNSNKKYYNNLLFVNAKSCLIISRNYFTLTNGFEINDNWNVSYDKFIYDIKNKLKLNIILNNSNIRGISMFYGQYDNKIIAIKQKNDIELSCPKIFHYYWDDFKKFTFMNLYSLKTSVYYHPEYIHVIWQPNDLNNIITWNEYNNKEVIYNNNYNNYIEQIKKLKVKTIKINIGDFINVPNNISEIHKSDIFRYKILNTFGGIWSDLDIVYIKKITTLINFDFVNIFFKCYAKHLKNKKYKSYYYPVGLLLAKRKTKFYNELLKDILEKYYDKLRYQCVGSEMFKKIFENKNFSIEENQITFLNEEFYMSYIWEEITELFIDYKKNKKNLTNTTGFHWFNGSDITKKIIKNIEQNGITKEFEGIIFIEKDKILLL